MNAYFTDMTYLAKLMPELAAQVALPDLRTVVQFFMTNNQRFAEGIAAPTSAVDSTQQPPFAPKPIDMLSHLKEYVGNNIYYHLDRRFILQYFILFPVVATRKRTPKILKSSPPRPPLPHPP